MANEQTTPSLKAALLAGFVVPSLGHFLLKRRSHGVLFAACIYGLFIAGMLISSMTAIDPEHHPVYWWLTQFPAGLPAWVVRWGSLMQEPLIGETVSISGQMYGLAYVSIAGLCNILSLVELAKHALPAEEQAADSEKERA